MKTLILAAAAAAFVGGLGLVATPASAALGGPASGTAGPASVEQARMTRRERLMRHRAMRSRPMRGPRMMRGDDSNARNPSRPSYQQQRGGTAGGPRD